MRKEQLVGSQTAKNGFLNEDDIVEKFNNWSFDEDAQKWLLIMEYQLNDIDYVKAIKLNGYKTDVQVQVTIKLNAIDAQNLQVKLVSNPKGFNQIDKRWVDKYVEMWNVPLEIISIFKKYTGEIEPTIENPKDKRRMFANEFTLDEQENILCLNHYGNGNIEITKQGNFKIGRITMQRKGGDNGRDTAKMLQFKINPAELFDNE